MAVLAGCAQVHRPQAAARDAGDDGRTDASEAERPKNDDAGQLPAVPRGVIEVPDCEVDAGYKVTRIEGQPGSPEVYVLAVYESGQNGSHVLQGEVSVSVERKAPLMLVLSSYEHTHWTVTSDSGSNIEQVILSGYYSQSASVDGQVKAIVNRSGDIHAGAFGDTKALIAGSEQLSGHPITEMAGCYRAHTFVITDAE